MSSSAPTARRRSPELMIAISIAMAVEVVTFGGLVLAVWLIGERPDGSISHLFPSTIVAIAGGASLAAGSAALLVLRNRRFAFVVAAVFGVAAIASGLEPLRSIVAESGFGSSTKLDGFVLIASFHLLHLAALVGLFAWAALRGLSASGDFILSSAWYFLALLYIPLTWTFTQ